MKMDFSTSCGSQITPRKRGLNTLPTEILQQIAHSSDDYTLCSLRRISSTVQDGVSYIIGKRFFSVIAIFSHPHSLEALHNISTSPFAQYVRRINFSTEQFGIISSCQDERAKRGLTCCTQSRTLKPVAERIRRDAAVVRDALSKFPHLECVFLGDIDQRFGEELRRPIGLTQIERVAYFCPAAHPSSREPGIARIFGTVFKAIDNLESPRFNLCVSLGVDTHSWNQAVHSSPNATALYNLLESIRNKLTHLRLAIDLNHSYAKTYLSKFVSIFRLKHLEITAPSQHCPLTSPSHHDNFLIADLRLPHLRSIKFIGTVIQSPRLIKLLQNHRAQLEAVELINCSLVDPAQALYAATAEHACQMWRHILVEFQHLPNLVSLSLVGLHSAVSHARPALVGAGLRALVGPYGQWRSRLQVVEGLHAALIAIHFAAA